MQVRFPVLLRMACVLCWTVVFGIAAAVVVAAVAVVAVVAAAAVVAVALVLVCLLFDCEENPENLRRRLLQLTQWHRLPSIAAVVAAVAVVVPAVVVLAVAVPFAAPFPPPAACLPMP